MLYSASKGLLMARRKRQRVSPTPKTAATQPQPLPTLGASSDVAHDPHADSSVPETAQAAQTSQRASSAAAEAADVADPQQPAEANGKLSGSKAKRKRLKKLQQRLAEANDDAPLGAAGASSEAANGTQDDSGLHTTMAGGDEQAQTPVPGQDAAQRVQQPQAEASGGGVPVNGASAEAPGRPEGGTSAQQVGAALAAETPCEQASTRASSKRKSVRFHLRDNLFFEPGGQVPPPAVRTPPKAQPKVGGPLSPRVSCLADPDTMHCCVKGEDTQAAYAAVPSVVAHHSMAEDAGQRLEGEARYRSNIDQRKVKTALAEPEQHPSSCGRIVFLTQDSGHTYQIWQCVFMRPQRNLREAAV